MDVATLRRAGAHGRREGEEHMALHKAQVRQHARPRAQRRPPGTGQPVAPAAHHVHADVLSFAHVCALKTRGGSLGLSKLVGCALSLSLLAVAVAAQRLQNLSVTPGTSAVQESCAPSRPGAGPCNLVKRLAPPPQHLVLLRQLSDPGARSTAPGCPPWGSRRRP